MKGVPTNAVDRVNSANFMKRAVVFLFLAGAGLLLAVSWGQSAETAGSDSSGLLGKTAPDFALTNLAGNTVRLSDFKGKLVLLDFWATWCPPCLEEIPNFVQLQKQYQAKGFTMLGVALDDEGAVAVTPVAQKLGINYPLVIGNVKIANAYGGIQALPTAFLIGRDGRILKTLVDARSKAEWEQTIRSALAQDGTGRN